MHRSAVAWRKIQRDSVSTMAAISERPLLAESRRSKTSIPADLNVRYW